MAPDIFVKQLAALAPTPAELERLGLPKEEARRWIESFLCIERKHPLQADGGSDELMTFLRNWDCSNIEIGMIRFPDPPAARPGAMYVGCVEADPLLMLTDTGEIAVYELGTNKLLWWVARSGAHLLEAILLAARFLEARGSGRIDFNDYTAARHSASECASAAGGDEFLDFYKMLLGAE